MYYLAKLDLTTHQGSQAFKDEVFRIVGVTESRTTDSLWGRAWTMGHEGGWEEILYCFWDLCEMEGL